MRKKKAIVSVINDLVTDQRVDRTCTTLHKLGFDVLLVGRKLNRSLSLQPREYKTKRINLLIEKGFLFYAFFNMRLFFFLLFHKADLLVANDLDTLLPNYLISKLKRRDLVYDSHELFCEVPELQHSKWKKKFWKRIERFCFPKLKNVFTVNNTIAEIYSREYNVDVKVVRNIPARKEVKQLKSKEELKLPADKKIILLQGGGINIERGVEEAVLAMQYIDGAIFLIIGGGDIIDLLKNMVVDLKLTEKVKFIPRLPFDELLQYTRLADVGLSIDKDTNSNYKYSLPNKIFDYINSGIPVIASPLVEIKKVFDEFEIGAMIENHKPEHIAEKIKFVLSNAEKQKFWRENCKLAAQKFNWENEEQELIKVFKRFA